MIERVDVAGGVILNDNRVLLVYNHSTDSWTYPKGHVNKGESFMETALREISEETNLDDLDYVSELPVYERPTRQKKNKIKVIHMFMFRSASDKVQSNTASISEVKWVPIEEVAKYFSYDEEVKFFEKIKGKLRS